MPEFEFDIIDKILKLLFWGAKYASFNGFLTVYLSLKSNLSKMLQNSKKTNFNISFAYYFKLKNKAFLNV